MDLSTSPWCWSFSSNPVRAAYVASLETQISSLRDELANLYKTQGQNAQRLLSMNETLREKEESSRIDSESLRKAKDEIATLRRKVDQHAELMAEKDRTVQVLYMIYLSHTSHWMFWLDPTWRDQHVSTGAYSGRRTQSDTRQRQCKAPSTLARRETSGSQPHEWSKRAIRAFPPW